MEPEVTATPPAMAAMGLARHAAWNYVAMFATLLSGIVITALAFREVKTDLIGLYTIAVTTTGLLGISDPAIAFGVTRSTARLTAGQAVDEELRFVHGSHAILVVLAGSAGAGAVTAGIVLWTTGVVTLSGHAWLMLGLLVGSLVLQLLTAVLPAAAIGMEDFRTNAIASAALAATSVLVVVATIRALDVAALGLGQMVAMVISRAYLLRWSRRRAPWLNLRPERPRRAAVTALLSFSGPMVLLAIAAQLVAWTDVVSVGALVGASASALYRAGSIVPTQATGLIWRTYDVVFPLLSRSAHADQERATSLLTRVFSALSGVIFAAIIAVRQDIISVVTGGRSGLAEFVLVSFCLIWAVNVPAHGLSLLAIARGKHGLYVPVVLVEVVFNIVLTVVLVSAEGARGAAVATLVTILVSNLVAIPLVLRGAIPSAFTLTIVDGVLPLMLYGTVSLVALSMLRTLDPTAVRLVLQGGVALILCSAAVAFGGGATGRRALRSSLRRHEPV